MIQKIYSGHNVRSRLHKILSENSPDKIFLVTGKKSFYLSGADNLLSEILNRYEYCRFHDFETNPKIEDIKKGIDLFESEACDFVIGVGGGSVMDMAKAISLLAGQNVDLKELIKGQAHITKRQVPSVMIPSTAGSGSESTHFSVVYIDKVKYSLSHDSMLADYAILAPALTEKLPAYISACTGMDALSQGIESFWSVNSTEESRKYSEEALKLVLLNIVNAVNNPDKKIRENLLLASNLAGRAINIAQTTAAHALSYSLTSHFNVPHGHAVALLLPHLIEFNDGITSLNQQDSRGYEFVKIRLEELFALMGVETALQARDKIISIMKDIGLETSLKGFGISKSDLRIITEDFANSQRLKNNPRLIDENDTRSLLEKIL